MPTPLPEGQEIVVTHIYFEHQYNMDSMQMATDHYNIGITLQGHRRTITPTMSYSYQAGDVALAPPFMFQVQRSIPHHFLRRLLTPLPIWKIIIKSSRPWKK